MTESSLPRARAFTEKVYSLRVLGKELGNYLVLGRYNLTPSYATRTLFDVYKPPTSYAGEQKEKTARSTEILAQAVLLVVSCCALLKLIFWRSRVVVYSSDFVSSTEDNYDARMSTAYKVLRARGISFVECFHTNVAFIPHLLKRRRVALYLEAIDVVFSILHKLGLLRVYDFTEAEPTWQGVTETERNQIRRILTAHSLWLVLSDFRVRVLSRVFRLTGIKVLLAMDDPRHNRELILACRRAGIETIELQHGAFTKYNLGHIGFSWLEGEFVFPDRLLVWSDYWKRELINFGSYIPDSVIQVGGWDLAAKDGPRKPYRDGEPLGILVPYETAAPKGEMSEFITSLQQSNSSARIYFKLRRDRGRQEQLDEYGLKEGARLTCIDDVTPILSLIHVSVGMYSTLLYQLIAEGIPVGILQTNFDYGERLISNGLAYPLSLGDPKRLVSELKTIAKTPPEQIRSAQSKLFGDKPKSMYTSLDKLLAATC